jgi:AcrR family transcriptional regulator
VRALVKYGVAPRLDPELRFGLCCARMARRKDQAARRGQIRQAARRAIATHGADRLRVKDVAAEAGLSSQAVLYYYPELDALVEEAIRHTLERFAERRAEAVDQGADSRRALVATIAAGLPAGPDDEDLRVLYGAAGRFRDNPALGALIRSLTARQVEIYRRLLELGEARGHFALAASSEAIARNLVALEDAYGLYIIGGAPIAAEAFRLILSFASMATGCRLDADAAELSRILK